jgi:hypothetical protein
VPTCLGHLRVIILFSRFLKSTTSSSMWSKALLAVMIAPLSTGKPSILCLCQGLHIFGCAVSKSLTSCVPIRQHPSRSMARAALASVVSKRLFPLRGSSFSLHNFPIASQS